MSGTLVAVPVVSMRAVTATLCSRRHLRGIFFIKRFVKATLNFLRLSDVSAEGPTTAQRRQMLFPDPPESEARCQRRDTAIRVLVMQNILLEIYHRPILLKESKTARDPLTKQTLCPWQGEFFLSIICRGRNLPRGSSPLVRKDLPPRGEDAAPGGNSAKDEGSCLLHLGLKRAKWMLQNGALRRIQRGVGGGAQAPQEIRLGGMKLGMSARGSSLLARGRIAFEHCLGALNHQFPLIGITGMLWLGGEPGCGLHVGGLFDAAPCSEQWLGAALGVVTMNGRASLGHSQILVSCEEICFERKRKRFSLPRVDCKNMTRKARARPTSVCGCV